MLNASIDLIDRLSAAGSAEKRWQVANEAIYALGGNGLTIAVVDTRSITPYWAQSSADSAWLQEYVDKAYYEADPFLLNLQRETLGDLAVAGGMKRTEAPSKKALELNWGLKDAGFTMMKSNLFAGGPAHSKKCVTFCTDEDLTHFGEDQLARIRHASTLIAAFVDPLEGAEDSILAQGLRELRREKLTVRERQVLMGLANGLQNTQIAHDLDIAEVTVRKTLLSVRSKLGARTREEALAIAIRMQLLE